MGRLGGQPAQRRNEESIRTLERLGIAVERMTFLDQMHDIPDGRLHELLPRVVHELELLVRTIDAPLQIILPAREGGHQDHDASHLAAIAAARNAVGRQLWQSPCTTAQA